METENAINVIDNLFVLSVIMLFFLIIVVMKKNYVIVGYQKDSNVINVLMEFIVVQIHQF